MRFLYPLMVAVLVLPVTVDANVVISEFMASNGSTLNDDFGNSEDWIEINNLGATEVDLLDWSLTDSAGNLSKWRFPSTNLPPGGHMIVFASNRDRRIPGLPLHTSFKLGASGEYLALVRPDGSVATQFSPSYPGQLPDVSFGFGLLTTSTTLVPTGASARILVPSAANGGSTLGDTWTGATNNEPFNTTSWLNGPLGAGFSAGSPLVAPTSMVVRFNFDVAPVSDVIVDSKPLGTPHDGLNDGPGWAANDTDTASSPTIRNGVMQFSASGSDWITLAADPDFDTPQGTIMFWMRSPGASGSGNEGAMIFDRRTSAGTVIVLKDNGAIFVQCSGGANSFSAGSVADNQWHHIAVTYDQADITGGVEIFIDGVSHGSNPNDAAWLWPAGQQIELGRSHDGYWKHFDGAMDDLRIHDEILAPAEIAQIAIGDDAVNPADIATDLQTPMFNTNASAFVRVPFVVSDPAEFSQLSLSMKYDDGFVAWLNGVEVARANAPTNLDWNSSATSTHSSSSTESFVIGNPENFLLPGTNVLAIQGLNVSDKNSTFLVSPGLTGLTVAAWSTNGMYFTTPTPGELNLGGATIPGPILQNVLHTPNIPLDTEDIRVTATVLPTFHPISSVTMNYHVMFGSEGPVSMNDSGTSGDLVAGDDVWSALIPASASNVGQMVRYSITATDTQTTTSRWPLYTDPANSAEYLGTVIQPDYVTSKLPVLHLFAPANVLDPGPATSQIGADSESGGRVSAYFDGEFYDNIYMELRGNSTAGYNKKSHRLEFNREHQFRHPGPGGRVRKTSFTADYPDPSYMRQGLSFWLSGEIGAPGPFYDPYRLQLNGQFYQLANHNDVHGEGLLDRLGYDPDGALYNAAGMIVPSGASTGGFDKKSRTWENNSDYVALADAVSESLSTGERATNLFNHLDLPQIISYMVAARFVHENDDAWANMSVYHDNDGDDLWRIIPFDMNLSWGAAYVDSSALQGIQVNNDAVKSHPLYGSYPTRYGNWNRLYDAIFEVPQTREMFLRRMRTVLDTWVKPPGTPIDQLPIEAKALAWRDLIAEEAAIDRAWWGWPANGGQSNFDPGIGLTNGVIILLQDFLEQRRQHFYGKHSILNTALPVGISNTDNAGIPHAQPTNAAVSIIGWDYNPVSGNQDEEYICVTNANNYAVDLSGWKLGGGVTHKFQPSTVIPAHTALYLTPNSRTFRDRAVAPHGGMGLFVQGGYNGHLNAWGETLTITDDTGRLVSSNSFAGTPSLAQQFLRITEVMYNPPPTPAISSDAQDFEYIELRNISAVTTVDLTGCRFTNGVVFSFTGSAVTSLAPGQRVLVVRDTAAFTAQYGGGALIAGEFTGTLDNRGETIRLDDATGEKILEFAYNNAWYRTTDGLGFSLVIVNDLALWSTWDKKASWRPSGSFNGSPGTSDTAANIAPILVNEVLAHTDLPLVDSIELYNPTSASVNLGGWYLTDDIAVPRKYRIPNGTTIAANGYATFDANQFGSAFLLSEYGDIAWLLSGDTSTNLTGYSTSQDFSVSPNGVSFGRYVNSQTNEHFVLQSVNTLNAANAAPRVGPIVISEIMYHPPDLPNGSDDNLNEFIELQNITGSSVPLYCTFTSVPGYGTAALTNTWRLRNAVDFDFPTNQTLAAGARLLVVGFNAATNTMQLAAFRTLYNVPANVPVFGPWQGKLDNSAETLELKYPDKPDLTGGLFVPYVMVDKVAYKDAVPWPANADGQGDSLQRRVVSSYGNDPTNWASVGITAGTTNSLNVLPTVAITAPTEGAALYRMPPITLSATASDVDGTIASVEFWDGANHLVTLTTPPYNWSWSNPSVGAHSLTAKAVDNLGGTRGTLPVNMTILSLPPTVTLTGPTNGASAPGGTVFTMTATASDPDSAVVGVDFYVDGILLDIDTSAPYTKNWTATTAGSHTLGAVARDESSSSAASSVTISVIPPPGQFNDTFALRGQINTYSQSVSGNNSSYTSESGEPDPPVGNKAHSAWLSWVAPASGSCTMDTDDSSFDTTLVIYTNNPPTLESLNNLEVVASDDDSGAGNRSKLTFTSVAAKTYQIAVYGYNSGNSGSISLNVDLQAPPAITTQPQSQTVAAGANVTFSVLARGTSPLSYQWRRNGINLSGATDDSLTLSNVQYAQAGDYTVVVANSLGNAISLAATLIVSSAPAPPSIITQPQSQTTSIGSNATFNVVANGTTPLAYQWRLADANIVAATAHTLTLSDVQSTQAGNYTVVITNVLGSVTSSVATLTVTLAPTTTVLFETNSIWWYLDDGSNQGTSWTAPAFDDSGWSSGPGKLGFKVPGNAGYATVVSYGPDSGNKHVTTYFRKQFVLASLAGVTHLTSELLRDDGVVLYLNGTPVFRNNLPEAPTYLQLATNASDNGAVFQTASIPTNVLVVGTNVLAAEIHQSSAGSSDLTFDMRLTMTAMRIAPDTDSDGMPDAWEQDHGLTVGVNDANLDLDLDGMSNIDEFLSKTHPNDLNSVLKLNPAGVAGGNVLLTFTAQAELGYSVQSVDSPGTASWQLWMQVSPVSTNRTITITNSGPLAVKRFFRVVTPQVP